MIRTYLPVSLISVASRGRYRLAGYFLPGRRLWTQPKLFLLLAPVLQYFIGGVELTRVELRRLVHWHAVWLSLRICSLPLRLVLLRLVDKGGALYGIIGSERLRMCRFDEGVV